MEPNSFPNRWSRFAEPAIRAGYRSTGVLAAIALSGLLQTAEVHAAPEGSADVGFVLEIVGDWSLQGDAPPKGRVLLGQALAGGARIEASDPLDPTARISIGLLDGKALSRSCATPGACAIPLEVPESLRTDTKATERFVRALKGVFVPAPQRYVPTLSRSHSASRLRECVVPRETWGIGLASCLSPELQEASTVYRVGLREVDAEGIPSPVPIYAADRFSASSHVPAKDLPAGLYEITLEQDASRRHESWLLVVDPGDLASIQEAFRGSIELTERWQRAADLPPGEARGFLRAHLVSLRRDLDERAER